MKTSSNETSYDIEIVETYDDEGDRRFDWALYDQSGEEIDGDYEFSESKALASAERARDRAANLNKPDRVVYSTRKKARDHSDAVEAEIVGALGEVPKRRNRLSGLMPEFIRLRRGM